MHPMTELKTICVYCGSNAGDSPAYTAAAETLGRLLAENGIRLIYGGGSVGLMGIVARTVLEHGGKVTGIIPQFLMDREVMLKEVDELVVTQDMHERKGKMFELSDAFVTLPGGIGTLEEVVEIASWAQLDQHKKPVLLVNIEHFWDPLVAQFKRMGEDGFLAKEFLGKHVHLPLTFIDSVEEALPTIRTALADVPREDLEKDNGVRLM